MKGHGLKGSLKGRERKPVPKDTYWRESFERATYTTARVCWFIPLAICVKAPGWKASCKGKANRPVQRVMFWRESSERGRYVTALVQW